MKGAGDAGYQGMRKKREEIKNDECLKQKRVQNM